jgi:hypothetical protein
VQAFKVVRAGQGIGMLEVKMTFDTDSARTLVTARAKRQVSPGGGFSFFPWNKSDQPASDINPAVGRAVLQLKADTRSVPPAGEASA